MKRRFGSQAAWGKSYFIMNESNEKWECQVIVDGRKCGYVLAPKTNPSNMVQHLIKRHSLEIPEEITEKVRNKRLKTMTTPDPATPTSLRSSLSVGIALRALPAFTSIDFPMGPFVGVSCTEETELITAVRSGESGTVAANLEAGGDPNSLLVSHLFFICFIFHLFLIIFNF
jgi:hypothetical protein